MTQPRRAQPADFLVTAVHNASLTALSMAVIAVALIGTDAAVAVHRSSGSSNQDPAAIGASSTTPTPGTTISPAATPSERGHATGAPSESDQAEALLTKAIDNALAKGSVHAVARTVSKKIGTAIFDDYDATGGGIQQISIYGGEVEVRVVGSTTYFRGDRRGLNRYMGFTDDEVAVLDHRWLTLVEGQAGYQAVTEGVTLASALHADRIVAPFHLLPERTINGIEVVGVQGRATENGAPKHAVATMWISTGETPLPVEFDAVNDKVRLTQTFSEWGEPIKLVAPANVYGAKTIQG